MFAEIGLRYLIKNYKFNTVLDIGSGSGQHAKILRNSGKKVTEIDMGRSIYSKRRKDEIFIEANYLDTEFAKGFTAIWICHVLEHQLNVHQFLRKVHNDLKEGGILAITVPPLKNAIVGGHISLWNAGLLLYHLILAGFNCKDVSIKKYGYNITIILQKETIKLPQLDYDYGDITKLLEYFPKGLHEGFNGNITELNWKSDK